ncbi:protein PFC0760c-like isoform X2 [Myzus persicae]|uniref:protein PFC0760c-like isoform X2 n=1 Tax=Myzus persicae TaxID=13164 RepID=UPI000B934344|nr:protein PFC0760c-like isoform X2 [Myzus persicae]
MCNISNILHVNAPQMYGMYMLRYEEMKMTNGQSVQEKMLFHVTTQSRAMESLDSGLDWRRTRRNKYGCGVSFSDDADYANFYADKFTSEESRVIMICTVLISETYVVPWNVKGDSLIVPPGLADTTMGNNGRVYVKYNDNDFYPLYFVYYQRRPEHMAMSKYSRANIRWPKDHYNYLEEIGYFDNDYDDNDTLGDYDDYSNELYDDDLYVDYIEDTDYNDDYDDDENDDYSNKLSYDDDLYADYLEDTGYYDDYDDDDIFEQIYYHDENDDYNSIELDVDEFDVDYLEATCYYDDDDDLYADQIETTDYYDEHDYDVNDDYSNELYDDDLHDDDLYNDDLYNDNLYADHLEATDYYDEHDYDVNDDYSNELDDDDLYADYLEDACYYDDYDYSNELYYDDISYADYCDD